MRALFNDLKSKYFSMKKESSQYSVGNLAPFPSFLKARSNAQSPRLSERKSIERSKELRKYASASDVNKPPGGGPEENTSPEKSHFLDIEQIGRGRSSSLTTPVPDTPSSRHL